ncbi:MAG: Dabb family protein, partial [Opitutales bacterium]|nr:Dabb family protein [Opitutales bacterium]
VLFDFKDGTTEESLNAIETKFTSLPGDIPEIAAYEWGTNNSPEGLDDGYSHCFLVSFNDEAGRGVYIPHPSHKEFGGVVRPNVEKVLVFDFYNGK